MPQKITLSKIFYPKLRLLVDGKLGGQTVHAIYGLNNGYVYNFDLDNSRGIRKSRSHGPGNVGIQIMPDDTPMFRLRKTNYVWAPKNYADEKNPFPTIFRHIEGTPYMIKQRMEGTATPGIFSDVHFVNGGERISNFLGTFGGTDFIRNTGATPQWFYKGSNLKLKGRNSNGGLSFVHRHGGYLLKDGTIYDPCDPYTVARRLYDKGMRLTAHRMPKSSRYGPLYDEFFGNK